jgi:dihydrofolate reductase
VARLLDVSREQATTEQAVGPHHDLGHGRHGAGGREVRPHEVAEAPEDVAVTLGPPGRADLHRDVAGAAGRAPDPNPDRLRTVARLIYPAIASLDGYVADRDGNFDWAEPDEEVHTFVNDLERSAGTHLYGRRMYEVMAVWETLDLADEPPSMRDYAEIWRAADKIVYSRTLERVSSARTRIERDFDPEAVRRLKESAERDVLVGGPTLAAHAIAAGLVDEWHLFVAPVVVGGGTRNLPDDVRLDLELMDERRFANGVVYLRYRTVDTSP